MALEKIETFCKDFKMDHLDVFVPILRKLELTSRIELDLKNKLNRGYQLIVIFIGDSEDGFPHGGKTKGPTQTIQDVLLYLIQLLSEISDVIHTIYIWLKKRRKRSYTYTHGYEKKWTTLLKEYDTAIDRWEILLEPLFVMVASPISNPRSSRIAQSRMVNTLNRFDKRIELPKAEQYTGYNQWTHRNQLPYGNFIQPSLSPRTRKSKSALRQTRRSPKGTKGTRF